MSLYINSAVASEHRAQLVREAAVWRLRAQANQANQANRAKRGARRAAKPGVVSSGASSVYCRRAACAGCTP